MRGERRRQAREQQAALMNSVQDHSDVNLERLGPILDQAINRLSSDDRTAVLLRFFEQRDFRSVGAMIGASEDAARMRVNRALEKLQSILQHRGVTLTAAALGTTLAGQAVTAAPAGLAVTVAGTALAGSATATGISATFLKLMAMTKLKASIAGAVLVAAVATPLAIQHQTQVKLRDENQSLRQQVDQLNTENQRRSTLVAQPDRSDEKVSELLKLRAEVAMLRSLTNDLAKLREENGRLRAAKPTQGGADNAEKPELAHSTQRGRVAKILSLPLLMYAADHQDHLPATFEQAAPYFAKSHGADPFMKDAEEFAELTKQFEIVYHGEREALNQLAKQQGIDPGSSILIREREPHKTAEGKWVKAYGMADGSGQMINADADGSFDWWEKRYIVSPLGQ
jgi:hypothetical protein